MFCSGQEPSEKKEEVPFPSPLKQGVPWRGSYGRIAAERIAEHSLTAGFEFFRPDVVARIGSSFFGIVFDIGHAALRMPPSLEECTRGAIEWIERMMPAIVEFRVHGILIDGASMIDHQPFPRNTALDYARIMSLLIEKDYAGPLMPEIEVPVDPETTVAYCREAKRELLACSARYRPGGVA